VNKVAEGAPHTVGLLKGREVDLVITTTRTADPVAGRDAAAMRRAALEHGVPYFTTVAGARAVAEAIRAQRSGDIEPIALQDLYPV
jgi:carbamoyl-phosphate synthase large subunit